MNPSNFIGNINIDFNAIFTYLISAELQEKLIIVKIVFLMIVAIILGIMIFINAKTHYLQWLFVQDLAQFIAMKPYGYKKINRQWERITKRLETGIESEHKLAIIEADDMLDAVLKRLGYAGQTLEEKLKNLTSATLPNIQQLYEIHRLRNNIVHDPDYRLTQEEAKKTLDTYGAAFRDLQILSE